MGYMSQFRRFSGPNVLKSENNFSNDRSIGSIRLCPSRFDLLSMCMINVENVDEYTDALNYKHILNAIDYPSIRVT